MPVENVLEEIAEVVNVLGLNEEQKSMVRGMINYLRRGEESQDSSHAVHNEARNSKGIQSYSKKI